MKRLLSLVLMCFCASLALAGAGQGTGQRPVRSEMPNWQVLPDGSLVIIHRGVRTGVDSDGEYE